MGVVGEICHVVLGLVAAGVVVTAFSTGLGYMGQGKRNDKRVCILTKAQLAEACKNKFTFTGVKDSLTDSNGQFELFRILSYPARLFGDCLGYGLNYLIYGAGEGAPKGFMSYEEFKNTKVAD